MDILGRSFMLIALGVKGLTNGFHVADCMFK